MSINIYDEEYPDTYNLIQKYIKSNKKHWFSFNKRFDEQGKQGITGILDVKNKKCVFKTSQHFNHIIKHEYSIMKSLKDIAPCCPFFTLGYGILKHDSDFDYQHKSNLFEVERSKYMHNESLLMQHIDSNIDFTDFIEDEDEVYDKHREHIIYGIIKQVLCALTISQRLKNFCHYDLHSSNVLLTSCDKDLVVCSIVNKKNCIVIPTFGMLPKIIDYGFSYTKDLEHKNFHATLAHTNVGFLTCTNDFISDLKLFLVTTSHDVNNSFKSDQSNTYRNIIRNIFKNLDIDWEAGWDNYSRSGASDLIISKLEDISETSHLFSKYDHVCIDLFQSLIKLPLKKKSYKKLEISYSAFLFEFKKIEDQLDSNIINMYILKQIIDISKSLKSNYINNPNETCLQFRSLVLTFIDTIIPFFVDKNINFEKMLCSIFVFSDCIEGFLYKEVSNKVEEQNDFYSKLPFKNPLQIFACLESNIPHNYVFNDDTQFLVLDVENNSRQIVKNIPKFIQCLLNKSNHLSHGNILLDYLNNNLNDHIQTYENIDIIHQQLLDEEQKEVEEVAEEIVDEVVNEVDDKVEEEKVVQEEKEEKEEKEVEEQPKKKRGRPKKVVEEQPKKKRGRPKKVVEEVEQPKKKRGRPKKVVDN